MNNFAVITKAEQDVAKAKAHLSVLKQKINDSKAKLEEAKKDYDDNINAVSSDNSGIHKINRKYIFMNIYFRLIL